MTTHSSNSKIIQHGLICFLVIGLQGLTGCAPFEQSTSPRSGTPAAPDSTKNTPKPEDLSLEDRKAESEILTNEGEDLLDLSTLNEAYGKFREALQYDSTNTRAGFLAAMVEPYLEFQGIVSRLRPFYMKHPEGAERYSRLLSRLSNGTSTAWSTYLTKGPSDIDSMEGVQEWLDRVIHRIVTFREFVNAHKNEELSVRIPSGFIPFGGEANQGRTSCRVTKLGPIVIQPTDCSERNYQDITFNRADLEYLQSVWGAFQMSFWTLNAYTLNPELVHQIGLSPAKIEARRKADPLMILGEGKFGKIRARDRFAALKPVLNNMAVAQLYFIENQHEICNPKANAKQRRRGFRPIFANGYCFADLEHARDRATGFLTALEETLAGRPMETDFRASDGKPIRFNAHLFLFQDPIEDLNVIAPAMVKTESGAVVDGGRLAKVVDKYFAHGSITDLMERKQNQSNGQSEQGAEEEK